MPRRSFGRRPVLGGLLAGALAPLAPGVTRAQPAGLQLKAMPSSGERLPVVGLGSWITFNVGDDPVARDVCAEIIGAFFQGGGRLIDSSPMYGSSQDVIGHAIDRLGRPPALFSATKVWTSSGADGPAQIEDARTLWRVPRFDLLQVHNLLAWEAHLDTLATMKAAGQLRYAGVSTSHGRRHDELEEIMTSRPIDTVQVTYNLLDREVEERILPIAAERGIAVIVNRPFQGGALLEQLDGEPLPAFAAELGCRTWAQYALKFVTSHPAVTCAIPATSRLDHVTENMQAAIGPVPDQALRARMAAHLESI